VCEKEDVYGENTRAGSGVWSFNRLIDRLVRPEKVACIEPVAESKVAQAA